MNKHTTEEAQPMTTRTFHVTYTDRNGAIQTARTSGTGSTPARQRAAAILNVKCMHPGSRNFSAVGVRIVQPTPEPFAGPDGRFSSDALLSHLGSRGIIHGDCDGCDRDVSSLIRKGGLWLCERCLGREL